MTRPKSFEAKAVGMLIDVLRKSSDQPMRPGFVLLIAHLANADLLTEIKQAQDEGGLAVCKAEKEQHVRHAQSGHAVLHIRCFPALEGSVVMSGVCLHVCRPPQQLLSTPGI